MVAAHHPPPHPHNRPVTPIVKRQTNRSGRLSKSVVILHNVSVTIPAFPVARTAQR